MTPKNHAHYTALYILYHVCYTKSTAAIIQLIQPGNSHHDLKYAVSIMNSILHSNYHQFFQLYQQSPSPAFTSVLNMHVPSMQELACKVMSVSYYNTSIDWVKKSSSLSGVNDDTAMQLIQRWSGGRVDRVDDHRLMWFKRGKIVRS
jgi:SAC3/GANP family